MENKENQNEEEKKNQRTLEPECSSLCEGMERTILFSLTFT